MVIKRVKYWCFVFILYIRCAPCYISSDGKGTESAARKTGCYMINKVRTVLECARYTTMHIMHNVLICRKL